MSAAEVRDRLGDRFRLLTGPEHGPDRQLTLRQRGGVVLRPAGRRRARGCCGRRRCSPAASTCRRCAPSPRRATTSRSCGSWTRWCASRWSSPTTAPPGPGTACSRPSGRSPRSSSRRRRARGRCAIGMPRTSRARPPPDGSAGTVPGGVTRSTGCRPSWPTCGPRSGGAAIAARSTVATDVAAHAALMGFSVELFETIGWAESLLDEAARADVRRLPGCTPRRATPASSGAPRPRPRTPTAPPSWRPDPGYESCEPGYATFIEALGRGLLREPGSLRRADPRGRGAARAPAGPTAIAAYVDGLQSAGRVDEALELTDAALEAARDLGNPYWIAYTLVDRRVGLVEGGPAARAGDLGRGAWRTSVSTTSGSSRGSWPATPRCCTPRTASWRRP